MSTKSMGLGWWSSVSFRPVDMPTVAPSVWMPAPKSLLATFHYAITGQSLIRTDAQEWTAYNILLYAPLGTAHPDTPQPPPGILEPSPLTPEASRVTRQRDPYSPTC